MFYVFHIELNYDVYIVVHLHLINIVCIYYFIKHKVLQWKL